MSNVNFLEKLLDGVPVEWKALGNEEYFEIANSARKPVKASLREVGAIPYYGANNMALLHKSAIGQDIPNPK